MVKIELTTQEAQVLGIVIQEKLGLIHQQKELERPLITLIQKVMNKPKQQEESLE